MLQDEVAQRHADEFVLMVMDQAGWHLAGELVVPENMRLLMLPPCSPELNPAEHLWEAIREDCFANHVFADLDAVVSAFTTGLCDLEADPCQTRSMTGFGWIRFHIFERNLVTQQHQHPSWITSNTAQGFTAKRQILLIFKKAGQINCTAMGLRINGAHNDFGGHLPLDIVTRPQTSGRVKPQPAR
jgi:hypothetical protein